MSSFRPDSEVDPPGFVPQRIDGLAHFAEIAGDGSGLHDAVRSSDAEHVDTSDEGAVSPIVAPTLSAEDLQAAEQSGFERGLASVASEREALASLGTALDGAAAALRAGIEASFEEWIARERSASLELASAIAEAWVRQTLRADPNALGTLLETALSEAPDSKPRCIWLSQADCDRLAREREANGLSWEASDEVRLDADRSLLPGEFRVELDCGWIDGRFEQVRRSLLEFMTGREAADPREKESGRGRRGRGMTIAPVLEGEALSSELSSWNPFEVLGEVCSLIGLLVEVAGLELAVGSICEIDRGDRWIDAEVIGFRNDRALALPLENLDGLRVGACVRPTRTGGMAPYGSACLGRVLDGMGRPIDGGPPLAGRVEMRPLDAAPASTVSRARIDAPLDLGLRAVNAFATVGQGMRMGIFAGSGVGKSTLLGQLAGEADVDVSVIALIGERRREVREFLERDLGDALSRSVVIVSTSDEAAPMRTRAARLASAVAEGFRDDQQRVLLLMDSLTRFCTAQREIGLAAGEPPTTRGFTPSVWSALPKLLERAGTCEGAGSITGLYTVLVEGDDMNEPVADAARSLLDGHLELKREIAARGQFPAIDVLSSVSRVMPDISTENHRSLAVQCRKALSTYRRAEDLIAVGAYQAGSDPEIDRACEMMPRLDRFLSQGRGEFLALPECVEELARVVNGSGA